MGVLKRLTEEYFGKNERLEDRVVMSGVIRADFTDRNGVKHRNGYRVEDGSGETLKKLIGKLIEKRGLECDLNDIDVSNMETMDCLFHCSRFNGDISGWDVSGVTGMDHMFSHSEFNGDISGWDVRLDCDMTYMFDDSPLKNNPPEWYKEK